MKIAVCDDTPYDASYIMSLVTKFGDRNDQNFQIDIYKNGESLLEALKTTVYPIIFLDIYMGKKTGIDVARTIRTDMPDVDIIFVTSSKDHMLEGFEVKATHYLVKPFSYENLAIALERCMKNSDKIEAHYSVMSKKSTQLIKVKDIIYAEVYGHTSIIHLKDQAYTTFTSLSDIHDDLGNEFIRPHRSFLVNLAYITKIQTREIVLENGILIPIRKNGTKEMQVKWNQYCFEKLRSE